MKRFDWTGFRAVRYLGVAALALSILDFAHAKEPSKETSVEKQGAGASTTYLILLKKENALGFYTPEGEKLATVPVGTHPHEMVLSADGRYVYVTDNGTIYFNQPGKGGNTISIVDVIARKNVGKIDLGDFHRPHGIDIDHKTGLLAVTTELPDRLLLVDPKERKIVKDFDTKGKYAHVVTLGPGAKYGYVSHLGTGTVAAINLSTGEVTLIPTGDRPEGSTLSKDGREVYVGNKDGTTVAVIDTATQTLKGKIDIGKGAVRMATTPDGKKVVAALQYDKRIEVIDPVARKVTARIDLPAEVISLGLSRDGKLAFASNQDNDTVFIVSLDEEKLVRQIKTAPGAGPDPVMEIAVSPSAMATEKDVTASSKAGDVVIKKAGDIQWAPVEGLGKGVMIALCSTAIM